jgi:hypothetical protein
MAQPTCLACQTVSGAFTAPGDFMYEDGSWLAYPLCWAMRRGRDGDEDETAPKLHAFLAQKTPQERNARVHGPLHRFWMV